MSRSSGTRGGAVQPACGCPSAIPDDHGDSRPHGSDVFGRGRDCVCPGPGRARAGPAVREACALTPRALRHTTEPLRPLGLLLATGACAGAGAHMCAPGQGRMRPCLLRGVRALVPPSRAGARRSLAQRREHDHAERPACEHVSQVVHAQHDERDARAGTVSTMPAADDRRSRWRCGRDARERKRR